jgi:hypothetical protein
MMNNNPMNQIMNALQQGVNPNQIAMQLAQNNPSVRQAMQLVNGKTPEQVRDMAFQMAKQRGVDLYQLARNMGIQLPK